MGALLSVMAIAFQPNQGRDLHLGDVLITNCSSDLYGQLLSIQSGIYSLSMKYLESGNKTLTTLGIYYLLTAQSLTSFIKITPDHILKQKVVMTGVYLIDGNLAACLAEIASLGVTGIGLVAAAVACFSGDIFGCIALYAIINILPIAEAILLTQDC